MLSRKAGGAKLSKRGKEVVVDTRKVLEAVNRLILEKNDDDKVSFQFGSSSISRRLTRINSPKLDSTLHLAS